jgi:hypothetical protein
VLFRTAATEAGAGMPRLSGKLRATMLPGIGGPPSAAAPS